MGTGSSAVGKIKEVGNGYFKEGEYGKAAKAYSKALKYDKDNSILLSNRSACYLKLNKLKYALDDALSCVNLTPDWYKSYYRLAISFKSCNLLSESLVTLQKSLSIQEDSTVRSTLIELSSASPQPCRNNLMIWSNSNIRPTFIKQLEGIPITEIACGISHTLALSLSSFVYAWGDNSYNQCGLDGTCESPRLLTSLLSKSVSAIISGGAHNFAITNSGQVYAWGINRQGQCGTSKNMPYPELLPVSKVKAGSAGLAHSFLLLQDSSIHVSGCNTNGQLGVGSTENLFAFQKIDIKGNYISCGAVHSLIVTPELELFSTGGNHCGQLGLGDLRDRLVPSRVGLNQIALCKCGEEFSIVITSSSKVYAFGLGNVGQLGNDVQQSSVPVEVKEMSSKIGAEHVACTKSTVLVVTRNAETYVWGLVPDYSNVNSKQVRPERLTSLKLRNVKEIQNMRESFFIMNEYVLKESYIVGLPLKPINAGEKCSVKVNLIDSRCMFVLEPLDKVGVICFNEDGTENEGQVQCFWDNGYLIELRLLKAGYHYLYVFVNGVGLKNSPWICTVKPGQGIRAIGYVTDDKMIVYAGNTFTIIIKVFDRFGNLLKEDEKINFEASIAECQVLDFEEGCYRVKIRPTLIGKFELRIKALNEHIEFVVEEFKSPKDLTEIKRVDHLQLQVLPGITSKKHCEVAGLKDKYMVAELVEFSVISKDEFGNTTWHRSKPWEFEVPFAFDTKDSVDCCKTTVRGSSLKAGIFPIKLAYDQFWFFNKTIEFTSGPAHMPNTVFSGTGKAGFFFTQPCEKSFEIELFDEYFNPAASQLDVKSNSSFVLTRLTENKYKVEYEVKSPGRISFNLTSATGNTQLDIGVEKDPDLVKQEQMEFEIELKRKEIAEREKLRQAEEEKNRIEEEMRRRADLRKREKELEELQNKQKMQEDAELKRRQKIAERIKQQEITKKRAYEALKKLEEEKSAGEKKKWKRTGGGFVVPFIIED